MTNDGADGPGEIRGGGDLDDGLLAQLKGHYNPPPDAPLDAMWARIEADRLGMRGTGQHPPRAAARRRGSWWLGMTAALIVGVALGRASAHAAATSSRMAPHDVFSATKSEENGGGKRATVPAEPCEDQPATATP